MATQLGTTKRASHYLRTGQRFLTNGDKKRAIMSFQKAIEIDPNDFFSHHTLAVTLLADGQSNAAFEHWLIAIQLNPHYENVFLRFNHLPLSDEQLSRAIRACREAFEQNRNVALIHATLGALLRRQGKTEEAVTSLRTAIIAKTAQSHPDLARDESQEKTKGPQFFVIGGMKCGTTSLFSYICKHPDVIEPLAKEIHFFDECFDLGTDWYFSHFARIPESVPYVTGEATPCLGAPEVADRILHTIPKTKFIVILRDPTERAFSHHHHNRQYQGAKYDFYESILPDLQDTNTKHSLLKSPSAIRNIRSHYLIYGLYACALREWLSRFPRNQFLFLKTEDMFADPATLTSKVFEFIGLEPFEIKDFKQENAGTYKSHAEMDAKIRSDLNAYFQPHNEILEEMLGMEFGWPRKKGPKTWLGFSWKKAS